MKVDVYDTYARTSDGNLMHFDVLLPHSDQGNDEKKARAYALTWLETLDLRIADVTLSRCSFCHSEAANPEVEGHLEDQGYFVLPMEGIPASAAQGNRS